MLSQSRLGIDRRLPRRLGLGTVLWGLATLLAPARATAEEVELFVSLNYQTDPALLDCPSVAEFRGLVVQELGRDPFRQGAAERAVVIAERSDSGIEGLVTWVDRTGAVKGERQLRSSTPDCREFARELSFAIAVQIQLMDRERAVSARSTAPSDGAPGPSPEHFRAQPIADRPTELASERKAHDGERERLRWLLGGGPIVAFWLAPAVTFEGRLFLAARRRWLSVELGAEASYPTTFRDPEGKGFGYRLFSLSLSGCGHLAPLALCGQAKSTLLSVRGVGVDEPRSESGVMTQAGARLMATRTVGPTLAASLHLDALATLSPRTVTLNDRRVWTTPALVLLVGIDVMCELP